LEYAEEIFSLGHELLTAVRQEPGQRPLRLHVGVADSVPKIIVRQHLTPVFELGRTVRVVVAEVEDTALLTDLGAQGLGFVPVYSAVLDEIARSSRFQRVGIAKGPRMEIFAITAQRRLQHPGVVAMTFKSR
jgi:hypothetical protein